MINEKLAVIDPAKKIPNIVPLPIPETQLQEYKITLSTSSKSSQEKAKAIGEAPTEEAALIAAVQQRHPLFRTRATILSGEGKNLVKNNPEFQTIATVTEWVKQYIRYLEGPFKLKKGSDKVTELKAALAAAEQLHKNNPNLTLYAFVTTGQPSLVSEIKKPRWGKHGEARGWTDFCDVFTSIAEQLPNVQNPPPPPPP